jgi:protein-S-isoprenylcysteine O-methyltransferase Ste14
VAARGETRIPSLGPRGEEWVAIQVVLFGLAAVAGRVGPVYGGPGSGVLPVAGALLLLAGAVMAVRGVLDLRFALTVLPHPVDGAPLVTSGIYRHARHPIYGGIVVAALGWALWNLAWLALGMAAVLLVFFRLKSGREEVWLRQRYPDYEAYAARTRRMLPSLY